MLGVGLICLFHTEVVNAKGEGYIAADVSKESGSVFAWHVPRGIEVLFDSVIGDETCLLQVIHAFPNFH